MNERVVFSEGVKDLGGACRCLMRSFSDEALAVLLCREDDETCCLVLGRAGRVDVQTALSVTDRERAALGLEPGADGVSVFCRMTVPGDDPRDAGFDLSRLVLVAPSTGRGLEAVRPQRPCVPVRGIVSEGSDETLHEGKPAGGTA